MDIDTDTGAGRGADRPRPGRPGKLEKLGGPDKPGPQDRRGLRGALAAVTVAAITATAGMLFLGGQASAAPTTLRAGAEADGRYFGVAVGQGDLNNSTATSVAGSQFDMVTPENEMKWDTVEPNNGQFNFSPGDAIVNFATSHSERVRGHNLVWHQQLPGWMSGLSGSQAQSAMEAHITGEVSHFKGKIYAWDVVNEPFNDDGSFRQDVFYNAFGGGAQYIGDAIRTAHAADPAAKLYVNDYNIEGQGSKSDAMYNLAKTLLAQGVPLGGVGFESHFIVGQIPSSLQANMQRFADLGLDVAITELDDRMPTPASSGNLQQQATDDSNVVKACLAIAHCPGVTQWNISDADSWVPGTFSGYGAATMFDSNYQPKPAFNAVLSALSGASVPPSSSSSSSSSPPPPTTYANLAASFDNVGISADTNTAAGNLDGGGSSFSQTALTNANAGPGAQIASSGVTFTMPAAAAGSNDNTVPQNQVITMSGTGTLGFLLTSSYGPATGTGTLTYTDGSTQSYTLSSADWWSTTPASGSVLAVSSTYQNRPNNTTATQSGNIFSEAVTLTAGKTLASVQLPAGSPVASGTPALHIFAISTTTASSGGNTVTVTGPGNQSGTVGTAISGVQIQATDSGTGQTLAYTATGLPAGLAISSSGLITGTPTAAGTSTVTVTATDATGASGSATFTWTVTGGGTTTGVCHVTYAKTSEWAGGFTANVTIANTGTTAINGWSLAFAFPGDQKITNAWNATATQTGTAVTATNAAYNASIAPGANTSFGFQGTFTSNDSSPTGFTVNGAACS